MIFFSHNFFSKKHSKLKNLIIVKIRTTFLFINNFTFIKNRDLYRSPGKKDCIAYRSIY